MTRVLVTGGAGYIGSHTCKALSANGFVPVTYDNLCQGHREAVRWGPFEYGDIADRRRLDEVIVRHKPSAVIHFAAHAYVGESVADPGKYYRNNVAGSLSLLEAMRDHDIRNMVFSSSCAIYGNPGSEPITEDTPARPVNPYGMSKLMVERMLSDFQAAHGTGWIALRYFNAAGDDPDCETGEDHDPETRIIPLVLDAAAGLSRQFTILGTDYDTADGTCVRDYVHVSDLAAAHVSAVKSLADGLPSVALNLGTGRGYSVREVVDAVERVTGRKVPVELGPRRQGDPPSLTSNADKARDVLGWKPAYAEIDDIVRSAWKWHQHKARRISR